MFIVTPCCRFVTVATIAALPFVAACAGPAGSNACREWAQRTTVDRSHSAGPGVADHTRPVSVCHAAIEKRPNVAWNDYCSQLDRRLADKRQQPTVSVCPQAWQRYCDELDRRARMAVAVVEEPARTASRVASTGEQIASARAEFEQIRRDGFAEFQSTGRVPNAVVRKSAILAGRIERLERQLRVERIGDAGRR